MGDQQKPDKSEAELMFVTSIGVVLAGIVPLVTGNCVAGFASWGFVYIAYGIYLMASSTYEAFKNCQGKPKQADDKQTVVPFSPSYKQPIKKPPSIPRNPSSDSIEEW